MISFLPKIKQLISRVDKLIEKSESLRDDEDKSEWAKYLCILISGILEVSIKELTRNFTDKKANPKIKNFVEYKIKDITNCRISKISTILASFDNKNDKSWKELFKQKLNELGIEEEKKIGDHINSLISQRNIIAHGNTGSNITMTNIREYYLSVLKVVEILHEVIKS